MARILFVSLIALLWIDAGAAKPTMQCKGTLIQVGIDAETVRKKCGAPGSVTTEERPVFSGNRRTGTYTVEIWRYEKQGSFPAVLEVENGKVNSIRFET